MKFQKSLREKKGGGERGSREGQTDTAGEGQTDTPLYHPNLAQLSKNSTIKSSHPHDGDVWDLCWLFLLPR